MPNDAPTLDESERDRRPRLENFAVQPKPGADKEAWLVLLAKRCGGSWRSREVAGFTLLEPASAENTAGLTVGEAWELARVLLELGADSAEPTFRTRLPPPTLAEKQRHFGLWGHTPAARREALQKASQKNLHWATDLMGCPEAWKTWDKKHPGGRPGQGIRVAQLDTGYTPHWRILPALEKVDGDHIGLNLVGDDGPADRLRDARDPMPMKLPLISFPGHGTAVAGLVCLDDAGPTRPRGVAPGATLLPIRVSPSVIHMSFQNVCDAFVEATQRRLHVISMSLGGPISSGQLYQRVHEALDAGILVIAAAGNAIPGVVFPAAIPGVVACAACNVLAAPWDKSGLGAAVTITAPGEYVWYEKAVHAPEERPDPRHGDGTSYATAHVAGLAALWLSYHGRDFLIAKACGGRQELLPFLFRACLQSSAEKRPELEGFGFGAGIARADHLLKAEFLPLAKLEQAHKALEAGRKTWLRFQSWPQILNLPTLAETRQVPVQEVESQGLEKLEKLLLGGEKLDELEIAELMTLAATELELAAVLAKTAAEIRHWVSGEALRRFLLGQASGLSPGLRQKLEKARERSRRDLAARLPEIRLKPVAIPPGMTSQPRVRRLKAYAFDPSLQTSSAEVRVNEITITVPFESELLPGPIGEYLEVIDVDPASGCAYSPVDLDHPWLLAQDGVDRSESNPHFHQQMVYAVGMKTIGHFEEALGRPIFWSPLRPWDRTSDDREHATEIFVQGKPVQSDQFVRRLRLYPHALRSQNAFYSPAKRAILFGYFPAGSGSPGAEYPGGMVFTCLAHDIIAHEMTHALLDGIHYRYTEPSNPDVYAFHEAFADIVALLQRFTYRELLEDQIAKARGRLDAGTLMTRLALQFGQATGRHHALRDALGYVVEQSRQKAPGEWRTLAAEPGPDGQTATTITDAARNFGDDMRLVWQRFKADPALLDQVAEPHARGAFLVAAVFDAYLTIYEARVADLKRIATGGTGVLPAGDLHPDLVRRMAHEATLAAHHVLRMCIRALDYVPPTDLTFGEYLRALITADADLVPDDDRRYRVAFIEAFRKWGIYPRDVRTLSEESLRWTPIDLKLDASRALKDARDALMKWEPGESREEIFKAILKTQATLHATLEKMDDNPLKRRLLGGIDTGESFNVCNLRPARRIGPRGEYLTEMVVEVLQSRPAGEGEIPFRGGATLIIGWKRDQIMVRYSIYKRLDSSVREQRQREHLAASSEGGKAAEYSTEGLPDGWFSREEERQKWQAGRTYRAEDMRASSCDCRRQRQEGREKKTRLAIEPFALLHRR